MKRIKSIDESTEVSISFRLLGSPRCSSEKEVEENILEGR